MSNPLDELQDKVVLITGAGKGSGRMLAQALAQRGACVAANDISPINVDEVVQQIVSQGGRAKAYVEDVAKKLGAQWIIHQVQADFGRIDVLINHASVEPHVPLLEMDEWDWHRVLDVNLTGAFLMTQSAGRLMRAQGGGLILNLITASTVDTYKQAAFVASMSGLNGFTQQAARELDPYGIRVYGVQTTRERVVEKVFELLAEER